jgi:hypothetical protein
LLGLVTFVAIATSFVYRIRPMHEGSG